jgi:hypothetical protein
MSIQKDLDWMHGRVWIWWIVFIKLSYIRNNRIGGERNV